MEGSQPSHSWLFATGYLALWTAALLLLHRLYRFDAGEALAAFVILALLLPVLSLLATRGASAPEIIVRRPGVESSILLGYLAVLALVLVWGFGAVTRIESEPLHSIVLLGVKLAVIVALPAALICAAGGYSVRELMPFSLRRAELRPAAWMSLAVLGMQLTIGRGLTDIRAAHPPLWVLAVAAPLSYIWLVAEVGVVEEFFFRALLQERLARLLRSPWGGIFAASLLFGLVHAPGFYLRTAATMEALGPHPTVLMAAGYSIVITSLAGLFLGVLWMRTKNFAVVVLVHAAGDFLPNLVRWIQAFHFPLH